MPVKSELPEGSSFHIGAPSESDTILSEKCLQNMYGRMVPCKKNLKTLLLTMYPSLQILNEWFGRTIIHSCTKLSYDHAQSMIESPTRTVPETELPPIAPEHTSDEVHQAVLNLHRIAQELRKQRFLDGALRLDQVSSFLVSVQPTNLTCAYTACA